MQANLTAWLRPHSGTCGHVAPKGWRAKLARVRAAAGFKDWPNNGLRYSYASYRFAAINDAPRVSAELGHTSPQMLYSTYRELVLPADAQRYWQIAPPGEVEKVVAFDAAKASQIQA